MQRLLLATAAALLAAPTARAQMRIGVQENASSLPASHRVALDSAELIVGIGTQSMVRVRMPDGTFGVGTDSATMRRWAEAAEALPIVPPRAVDDSMRLAGALLRGNVSSNGLAPAMRLARLPAAAPDDTTRRYRLEATNGAWTGRTTLSPAAFRAMTDALRGRAPADSAPRAPTAYFEFQVDRPATDLHAGRAPQYPAELRHAGMQGTVQMEYIVDANGRMRPETVTLLGSTAPEFARAVHEILPTLRFTPALRGGTPVPMIVQQSFLFNLQ